MADEPAKPALPPLPHAVIEWSSMTPGDFGFKAVFWTDAAKTGLTFQPIIGWITYSHRPLLSAVPSNGFAPVVASTDQWCPWVPTGGPLWVGTAPIDATDEEVLARVHKTALKPAPATPPPAGGMLQ